MSLLATLCGTLCAFFATAGLLMGGVLFLFGGRGRRLVGAMLVLWWASGLSAATSLLLGDAGGAALGVAVWAAGGVGVLVGSSVGPNVGPDSARRGQRHLV